ncbi:MAG: 3'-5' exonuclease [Pseudobdellovibrionaceae bacterium]|nr:3'-5' exonuclease [Pseudobdellovibrionaceae bacterium]
MTWIAFDIETTGAYPVVDEVVEIGAIKFRGWEMLDSLQVLIKPTYPMSDEIVKIHGITNEMVAGAPSADKVSKKIWDFFKADFFVAHHAPFDLGFMAEFFEKENYSLPHGECLCTSLLSRQLVTGVPNHKLQTLAGYFGINPGKAHRALDDAHTCAQIFQNLVRLASSNFGYFSLSAFVEKQGYQLPWQRFSIKSHLHPMMPEIYDACKTRKDILITYNKGLMKNQIQRIKPLGIVLTPLDGDYVPAVSLMDQRKRRYQLAYLSNAQGSPSQDAF